MVAVELVRTAHAGLSPPLAFLAGVWRSGGAPRSAETGSSARRRQISKLCRLPARTQPPCRRSPPVSPPSLSRSLGPVPRRDDGGRGRLHVSWNELRTWSTFQPRSCEGRGTGSCLCRIRVRVRPDRGLRQLDVCRLLCSVERAHGRSERDPAVPRLLASVDAQLTEPPCALVRQVVRASVLQGLGQLAGMDHDWSQAVHFYRLVSKGQCVGPCLYVLVARAQQCGGACRIGQRLVANSASAAGRSCMRLRTVEHTRNGR